MSVFWGTRKCSADVDYAKLTGRHLEPLFDVARDTPLAKQSAIPQAQLDNDIQADAAAEALLSAAKGKRLLYRQPH